MPLALLTCQHRASTDQVYWALTALGAGLLLGWILLFVARRKDRRGWILARAPGLPVGVLAEHDDAWIRGVVVSEAPLRCPWFDVPCVYYDYEIERKVRRTVRDAKGRTRTETHWTTEHSESDVQSFWLVDGDDRIEVSLPRAEIDAVQSLGTDYETGSLRHSAKILPVGKVVSALGVKRDDGCFGPLREVPLLVTFQERAAFLARTCRDERWSRRFAYFFVFAGGLGAAVLWQTRSGQTPEPLHWALGVAAGLGALLPVWFLSTYNRIVRTRQQAEAAWRQVGVDISVRNGVLPQLTAVVEGYRDHERDLFEHVAALRTGRDAGELIAGEARAVHVTRGLLVLRERYPELEANTLFTDLHDRLWALEEKLAASRTFYNDVAREWNDLVESVPTVLVARTFAHGPRGYFRIDRGEDA